jgi:hypothetical protein
LLNSLASGLEVVIAFSLKVDIDGSARGCINQSSFSKMQVIGRKLMPMPDFQKLKNPVRMGVGLNGDREVHLDTAPGLAGSPLPAALIHRP